MVNNLEAVDPFWHLMVFHQNICLACTLATARGIIVFLSCLLASVFICSLTAGIGGVEIFREMIPGGDIVKLLKSVVSLFLKPAP